MCIYLLYFWIHKWVILVELFYSEKKLNSPKFPELVADEGKFTAKELEIYFTQKHLEEYKQKNSQKKEEKKSEDQNSSASTQAESNSGPEKREAEKKKKQKKKKEKQKDYSALNKEQAELEKHLLIAERLFFNIYSEPQITEMLERTFSIKEDWHLSFQLTLWGILMTTAVDDPIYITIMTRGAPKIVQNNIILQGAIEVLKGILKLGSTSPAYQRLIHLYHMLGHEEQLKSLYECEFDKLSNSQINEAQAQIEKFLDQKFISFKAATKIQAITLSNYNVAINEYFLYEKRSEDDIKVQKAQVLLILLYELAYAKRLRYQVQAKLPEETPVFFMLYSPSNNILMNSNL